MTTTRDHANGWACIDCLMLLANGETNPEWSDAETAEYFARLEERSIDGETVTLGRVFGEDGCEHTSEEWHSGDSRVQEDHAESCERTTFSRWPCDVCGSTLGGAREAVTFWTEEMAPTTGT
jgi:ribosomal protein L37AE/L43A